MQAVKHTASTRSQPYFNLGTTKKQPTPLRPHSTQFFIHSIDGKTQLYEGESFTLLTVESLNLSDFSFGILRF